jgi:hypothetical protein
VSEVAEVPLAKDEVIRLFLKDLRQCLRYYFVRRKKDEGNVLLDSVCRRAIVTDCSPGMKRATNAL